MLKNLMDDLQIIKKMSVTSICQKLGVSRQTYYNWIEGSHIPTFKNVIRLAECFSDDLPEQQQIAEKIWIAIFHTFIEGTNNGK